LHNKKCSFINIFVNFTSKQFSVTALYEEATVLVFFRNAQLSLLVNFAKDTLSTMFIDVSGR